MINRKAQITYIILFFLGIVTLINFVSAPLINEIFVQTYPEMNSGAFKADVLTLVYLDFTNAGLGVLGKPFLLLGLISGLWPVFLLAAYSIRKKYKFIDVESTEKHRYLTYYQKVNILERVWLDLLTKSSLARFIDILYKLALIITPITFIIIAINEGLFQKTNIFFYAFIAMSTVFTIGVVSYHILIWLILYILYGNDILKQNHQYKDVNAKKVYFSVVYIIIAGTIWTFLGS